MPWTRWTIERLQRQDDAIGAIAIVPLPAPAYHSNRSDGPPGRPSIWKLPSDLGPSSLTDACLTSNQRQVRSHGRSISPDSISRWPRRISTLSFQAADGEVRSQDRTSVGSCQSSCVKLNIAARNRARRQLAPRTQWC